MIKKFSLPFLMIVNSCCIAQSFTAKYNFASVSGTCVNNCLVDPSPVPVVAGINFGSFVAKGTGASPNASGRFSFQGWPIGGVNGVDTYSTFTGALSPSSYYEVTLAPQPAYTLALSWISFSVRRSGTGIRNYAVRSSLDGYVTNLSGTVGNNTNLSLLASNIFFWDFDATSTSVDQIGSQLVLDSSFSALTDTVSFRFYGWNSENGSLGTFSIDSVVFNGQASNTPPITTSVQEINVERKDIQIFPNPSYNGMLKLESSSAVMSLEVLNCLGAQVFQSGPFSPTYSAGADLGELPAGTYFVKVHFFNKECVYKRFAVCR